MKVLMEVDMSWTTMNSRALGLALAGALALATTAATAGAQTSSSGGGSGNATATAGARFRCVPTGDSTMSAVVCGRLQERDRLVRQLSEMKRKLEREALNEDDRDRLVDQIANLTLALSEMSTRIAIEVIPRAAAAVSPIVMEEMQRGVVEARRAMQAEAVFQRFAPKGWIGLHLEGEPEEIQVRDGALFLRFQDYPAVVSVDPNSPADAAGVRRGDVVLAYNGQDVTKVLPMSKILQPGTEVTVRVRRDGGPRDLRMKAVPAPVFVSARRVDQLAPLPPGMFGPPRPARAPEPTASARVVAGGSPRVPRVFVHEGPEGTRYSYEMGDWKGNPAIVGAQVQELSEELGDVIGVKRGILVLRVFPGTPASEAGLRQGDVVVRVGGREISTIGLLFSSIAVERAKGADYVVMDVARKGATRKVTLKWE